MTSYGIFVIRYFGVENVRTIGLLRRPAPTIVGAASTYHWPSEGASTYRWLSGGASTYHWPSGGCQHLPGNPAALGQKLRRKN